MRHVFVGSQYLLHFRCCFAFISHGHGYLMFLSISRIPMLWSIRGRNEKSYRPTHKTVIHEISAIIHADSITVKGWTWSFTKHSQLIGYPMVCVQYMLWKFDTCHLSLCKWFFFGSILLRSGYIGIIRPVPFYQVGMTIFQA